LFESGSKWVVGGFVAVVVVVVGKFRFGKRMFAEEVAGAVG